MCSLLLPPQVIKHIDKYRKHCLWSGGDINRKGCLAAWEPACRPKNEGGLRIIDLKNQNKALLLKHLDKFYNHAEIPWVQLTWEKLYANTSTPTTRNVLFFDILFMSKYMELMSHLKTYDIQLTKI